MKVPYFLLELGDVTIFQPQNIREGNSVYIGGHGSYSVQAAGSPQIMTRILFLNGHSKEASFNILKIPTTKMKTFETIIDNHNRSLDV